MKSKLISAIALFADDIRHEVDQRVTIVGIFPDNLNLNAKSSDNKTALPKLAVYWRAQISLDENPEQLGFQLLAPNGQIVFENSVDANFIESQRKITAEMGSPYITVVSQAIAAPFTIETNGIYEAIVKYGEHVLRAGMLRIKLVDAPNTSSELASPIRH